MRNILFPIFLTLLFAKLYHQASPSIKLIVEKIDVNYNASIVDWNHVLNLLPNDTCYFSANVTFLSKLDTFFFLYSISLMKGKGKYETFFKNGPTNICSSFKNLKGNAIVRTILNSKNFSKKKFPTSCPIEPGFFYIEDFKIDEKLLSFNNFEAKFIVKIELSKKVGTALVNFINLKVYAELKDLEKWEKENKEKLAKLNKTMEN
ncbi:CLUMA_CG001228, isoform A [Clunio marinus]|uniref:CLUMA_CG001228, isoform A n=1 Tax=Clunio marinus TaxID=568069 RepID=A0A1J1HIP2_9DIPT|nr:CLUMA_CG001228, isoform A [Clunio marinus]